MDEEEQNRKFTEAMLKGIEFLDSTDFDDAIDSFKTATSLREQSTDAFLNLSNAYMEKLNKKYKDTHGPEWPFVRSELIEEKPIKFSDETTGEIKTVLSTNLILPDKLEVPDGWFVQEGDEILEQYCRCFQRYVQLAPWDDGTINDIIGMTEMLARCVGDYNYGINILIKEQTSRFLHYKLWDELGSYYFGNNHDFPEIGKICFENTINSLTQMHNASIESLALAVKQINKIQEMDSDAFISQSMSEDEINALMNSIDGMFYHYINKGDEDVIITWANLVCMVEPNCLDIIIQELAEKCHKLSKYPLNNEFEHNGSILDNEKPFVYSQWELFHRFETTMRFYIERSLQDHYGSEWWKHGVPDKYRLQAEERRLIGIQKNPIHSNADPIQHLEFFHRTRNYTPFSSIP
ncbi:MAG: hypothetical protein Q7J68_01900 [Thermoplasmata archaeon]|nr:hypothetical protein [Thermoplasmata archaeon]